jgi:hypothetical protein
MPSLAMDAASNSAARQALKSGSSLSSGDLIYGLSLVQIATPSSTSRMEIKEGEDSRFLGTHPTTDNPDEISRANSHWFEVRHNPDKNGHPGILLQVI